METTEILQTLGIENAENLEQFKQKFNETFVSRKIAIDDEEIKTKVVGKITGGLSTLIKRELELDPKEIEGKKVEEIFTLGVTKLKGKISELEVNAAKTRDEAVAEWQTKAEKYKKDFTEYKTQTELLSKKLEETEQGFQNEKKNWTINQKFSDTRKKALSMFSEEVLKDNLKLEGFNTLITKKYKFDLDESNELVVYDAEGKRIQNTNKIGAFLSPEEVLLKEATENKLLKLNAGGTQSPIKPTFKAPEGSGDKSIKLHPNLARFSKSE